jgi:TRAP-type transport system periplasmic protein
VKKLLVVLGLIGLVTVLVISGCSQPSPAAKPTPSPTPTPAPAQKVTELSFITHVGAAADMYTKLYVPWMDKMAEVTKGQVKVTGFPGASVAKSPEQYDAVKSGLADIAAMWPSHAAGRFPLSMIPELPAMFSNSNTQAGKAYWDYYNTLAEVQAEWPGMKVLWTHMTIPNEIFTAKTPVRKLDDFKGLKIDTLGISPSGLGKALGFTPVSLPMGDLYLSLQKGVIDGHTFDPNAIFQYKTVELLKYWTNCDLGRNSCLVIMNLNKWNALPKEVQAQLEQVSGSVMVQKGYEYWDWTWNTRSKEAVEQMKLEKITLSPEEWAKWKAALNIVNTDYISDVKAKGLPADKALDAAIKLAEKYAK